MSFDLYFYKREDNQITEEEVAQYLSSNIPFNFSEYSRQWCYENPQTGVYFIIEWNERDTEIEEIELLDSFSGFINLNFSFNINLFRPFFFGVETFQIIEKFMDDLDLYVLNPQDQYDPIKVEKGSLLRNWSLCNDSIMEGKHKEYNLEYMPLTKSNDLWWYQYHKMELESNMIEDVFIPNLFIFKSHEDHKLYTVCSWPAHIPIVLPEVDYVCIKKEYEVLSQVVEENGLVAYATIMEKLGSYFTEFESNVPNLKLLTQQNADKMEEGFNNLPIYKAIDEFGVGVAKDGFVNLPYG